MHQPSVPALFCGSECWGREAQPSTSCVQRCQPASQHDQVKVDFDEHPNFIILRTWYALYYVYPVAVLGYHDSSYLHHCKVAFPRPKDVRGYQ